MIAKNINKLLEQAAASLLVIVNPFEFIPIVEPAGYKVPLYVKAKGKEVELKLLSSFKLLPLIAVAPVFIYVV